MGTKKPEKTANDHGSHIGSGAKSREVIAGVVMAGSALIGWTTGQLYKDREDAVSNPPTPASVVREDIVSTVADIIADIGELISLVMLLLGSLGPEERATVEAKIRSQGINPERPKEVEGLMRSKVPQVVENVRANAPRYGSVERAKVRANLEQAIAGLRSLGLKAGDNPELSAALIQSLEAVKGMLQLYNQPEPYSHPAPVDLFGYNPSKFAVGEKVTGTQITWDPNSTPDINFNQPERPVFEQDKETGRSITWNIPPWDPSSVPEDRGS